ncbi:hypothetical protein D3C72_2325100 [compost metagenome]
MSTGLSVIWALPSALKYQEPADCIMMRSQPASLGSIGSRMPPVFSFTAVPISMSLSQVMFSRSAAVKPASSSRSER